MNASAKSNSSFQNTLPLLLGSFRTDWIVPLSIFITTVQFCYASPSTHWSSSSDSAAPTHRSSRTQETIKDLSPFSPGSNNLALDLGQVFLMGDIGKYTDSLGTQLHYTYGVSDLFGFDSSFGYSQHANGQFSMLSLLTGLRMNLSWYDKVVPYGIFGVGFYKPSFQDNSSPPTPNTGGLNSTSPGAITAILFGLHVGPGIDLELSRNLFFGAALTLNTMFGTTLSMANGSPTNVGGTYSTFFVHFGATF